MTMQDQHAWMSVYALRYHEYLNVKGTPDEARATALLVMAQNRLLREGCTMRDVYDIQSIVKYERERAETK